MVGYTSNTSGDNFNFVVAPFNAIGYNTADIQQFKIDDGGAGTIGWGSENFSIWEGLPTVVEGSEFSYWDASMDPSGEATTCYWGDSSMETAVFSIAPGQSFVVDCAGDLSFTTSGQVPSEKVEFTSNDNFNFTGNPFPASIDIQSIKIDDGGAGTIGWGSENFSVWEGLPTVAEGSEFSYWDASMDPTGEATSCYWGDSSMEPATFAIPAGQGVVIDCTAGLTISIDPPYSL